MTSRESGRPFPRLSADDVVDFCITEAMTVRVDKERKEAQKEQEREAWRKKHRQVGREA